MPLFRTAILGAFLSVGVAFLLSVTSDGFYLPVLGYLGDEPWAIAFFLIPVAATIAVGVMGRRPAGVISLAGFLAAVTTVLTAYAAWIGWIFVVCGLQDNACFD
jgi:hypothetical protein